MALQDLLTLEALLLALSVRQAKRELDAAVLFEEIVLRERAQKNRPACQCRAVLTSGEMQ